MVFRIFFAVAVAIFGSSCGVRITKLRTSLPSSNSPNALIQVSGNLQSAPVTTTLPAPLVVRTLDQDGAPIGGVEITFIVVSGGGTLSTTLVRTDAQGLARTTWTFGTLAGHHTATAFMGTLDSVDFTATALADVPVKLAVTGPSSINRSACSSAIVVSRYDQYDNPAAPATVDALGIAGIGGGNLYAASPCTGATANSPSILAGQSHVVLFFKDTLVENLVLNITSGNGLLGTTLPLTVQGALSPATYYNSGDMTERLTSADFNADGIADLAVVSRTDARLNIFLGNGDGTFPAPVTYAAAAQPRDVKAADLDHDGHLDLVVSNWGANSFSVFRGIGDGTFQAKVDTANGGAPLEPILADFNGDGNLDLVLGKYTNDQINVFMGNGNGGFGAPTAYATCDGPLYGVTSDFDHDGDVDVVVSCLLGDRIAYYTNTGNGVFAARVETLLGDEVGHMVARDFNFDGNVDVAVSEEGIDSVAVLLGNGNGTFQAPLRFPTSDVPVSLESGDFDDDGKLDIAVVAKGALTLEIHYGAGDGNFAGGVPYPLGADSVGLATGDFNGDGEPDFAASARGNDKLTILLAIGRSQPARAGARNEIPTVASPTDVIAADFNHDGQLDLLASSSVVGVNSVELRLGTGDGSFSAGSQHATGVVLDAAGSVVKLGSGDFNRDGEIDVFAVFSATGQISVLLGDGAGGFSVPALLSTGASPRAMEWADFDRDGLLDIAVASEDDSEIQIFLGDGTGNFSAPIGFATGTSPTAIASFDLNRDGKKDLVAGCADGRVAVHFGIGDGTFASGVDFPTPLGATDIRFADVDRDGETDVLVAHGAANEFSVLPNDGAGNLGVAQSYATAEAIVQLRPVDLNRDGFMDLVIVLTGSSDTLAYFINDGTGVFFAGNTHPTLDQPAGLATGDFNHDGVIDFATASRTSSKLNVYFGNP